MEVFVLRIGDAVDRPAEQIDVLIVADRNVRKNIRFVEVSDNRLGREVFNFGDRFASAFVAAKQPAGDRVLLIQGVFEGFRSNRKRRREQVNVFDWVSKLIQRIPNHTNSIARLASVAVLDHNVLTDRAVGVQSQNLRRPLKQESIGVQEVCENLIRVYDTEVGRPGHRSLTTIKKHSRVVAITHRRPQRDLRIRQGRECRDVLL